MSATGNGNRVHTHNFRREASVVTKVNDRVIEVIHIRLVAGLELMKEFENLETEDSLRPSQRGREPSPPKQLSTTVPVICWSATAVSNDGLVDAAEIEDSELITPGGVRTCVASLVTQLHHEAEGGKGFGGEILTVPLLQGEWGE